jgi:outer membrane receptor protein involved in Fe transport
VRLRAGLLLALGVGGAHAQEIVVTAERRAQDLRDVPTNVAALDAHDLRRIGAHHPSEVLNRLAGVNIHRGSGAESLPAIRSPVLTGGQGAGSFLVLEDGVPIRAPGFANINQVFETSLDFAERVELTRGPGSALYGANAVHGLVNVITAAGERTRDDDHAWQAESAQAGFGSFGRWNLAARAAAPGAIALGMAVKHEDGWRTDAGLDQHALHLAARASFGAWTLEPRVAFSNLNQETAGFVDGANADRNEAAVRLNANPEAFRDSQSLRAHVTASRTVGTWEVRVTPFARVVETDLLQHFFPSRALEITAQRGGGVQSALYWDPGADVSVIFGADWDHTRASLFEFQSRPTQAGGYTQGLHYDYRVEADVFALFAQSAWAFAPDWRLVAGLRGERSLFDYDNRAPTGDVGRFRRPADRADTFETLTPKLGLTHALGETGTAWLTLSRGARAPQAADLYSLQTLQQAGAQKAETINSAEIGYRRRSDTVDLEIAAFAMEKNNGAFRNADGFTVLNARTRHEGVEVSGAWRISAAFGVAGWVSYAKHAYAFSDSVSRAGESIRAGDDIDTAPRRLANLTATLALPRNLDVDVTWTHMGAYATNAANTRYYPGHDVFDARLRWALSENTQASLAVRNLFDERYAERADFAFGADRYFPGESRGVSVALSRRFN